MADRFIYINSAGDKKSIEGSTGGNGSADSAKPARFGSFGQLNAEHLFATSDLATGVRYKNSGPEYSHGSGWTTALGFTAPTDHRIISLPDASGMVLLQAAQAVKAWVNFNGTTNNNQAATYERTGNTVTVSLADHGYIVGHVVQIDFTSGGALDGTYTIDSVPTSGAFTVTTAASGAIAAGNTLNLLRNTINASYGVHSVTDIATGIFRVNFTAALADEFYAVSGIPSTPGANGFMFTGGVANTAESCYIQSFNVSLAALTNFTHTRVIVTR